MQRKEKSQTIQSINHQKNRGGSHPEFVEILPKGATK
jgi:hypothetical protein